MENQRFDIDHIRKYVNGELSPREMYALERASHEDEILMDLILGVEAEKSKNSNFNLPEILKQIDERVSPTPIKRINFLKLSAIAASILLICGVGYYFLGNQQESAIDNYLAHIEAPKGNRTTTKDSVRPTKIQNTIPPMPDDKPLATTSETEKNHKPRKQTTAKKEVKELPRIRINDAVPGIRTDSVSQLAGSDSQRLATLGDEINHSPIIEIHTNRESALAANARMITRKSHMLDTLEDNIYGYTSDQRPVSSGSIISQDSPYHGAQVNSSIARLKQGANETANKNVAATEPLKEYTVTKETAPRRSEPIVGWNSYREYIKKATREYPHRNGTVNISMDINKEGQPENIRILETSSDSLSSIAISIIQQGPRWIQGRRYSNVKLKIDFNN